MQIRKHMLRLGCGVLCALTLTACSRTGNAETEPAAGTAPTAEAFDGCRLTFMIGDQKSTLPVPEGYRFAGWQNEQGQPADPMNSAGNQTFVPVFCPDLSNHVPYLFPDSSGNIRPGDFLTGEELSSALTALAADPAAVADLDIPAGTVSREALQELCPELFPAEQAELLTAELPEGNVTRQDFAVLMNGLLGRGQEELLTVENGQTVPADIMPFTEEGKQMLEASVAHTPDKHGVTMEHTLLDLGMEPGFYLHDGWLYYICESGNLLKNATLCTLHFDADGRYTSGDPELDQMVAEKIAEFTEENPDQTREQLLETAFLYCRDNFRYVNRGLLEFGETGWEIQWAKKMLQTGAGNCYNYAAAYWAMARQLGFNARCYSGSTGEARDPHSWVQIDFDGEPFIFDPELAMAYLRDGKQYEEMYKMPMWEAKQWPYHWPYNG